MACILHHNQHLFRIHLVRQVRRRERHDGGVLTTFRAVLVREVERDHDLFAERGGRDDAPRGGGQRQQRRRVWLSYVYPLLIFICNKYYSV